MRDLSNIPGIFWSEDIGFVCEDRYRDVGVSDGQLINRPDIRDVLQASHKLPPLAGAPVASWVLARLALLCGRKYPFSHGQVLGSDGADYWLRFYCILRSGKPAGIVVCCGSEDHVALSSKHPKAVEGNQILDAFQNALLAEPNKVIPCRIVVQYTEFTDPEIAFHIPRAYGYDGEQFLNEQCPEHAIDPTEYD